MEEKDPLGGAVASVLLLIALSIAVTMCSSCTTTRYVTKEVPKVVTETVRDTIMMTKVVHTSDTTFIHDSVAPNNMGGLDRWHSEYRGSREKVHDTIYINKEVEKPVPYEVRVEVPVEVEKKRSLWERLTEAIGFILVGVILSTLVRFVIRLKK